MNFYKHFIGDYLRDTKGLSIAEHGAYLILLQHNYATEQPIPNDLQDLYRIAGAMTAGERKAVEKVADKFFAVNGDGRRHNKRAEEEIEKHQLQAEHNRTVGKLGGRPRKPGNNPSGIPEETRTVTRMEPGDNPSHSQNQSNSNTSPASQGKPTAAPLAPDCPHEKLIDLYHALLPDSPKVERWTAQRSQVMRARWRDEAKPNRDKHAGYTTVEEGLAYWRRFFKWVADSKFLTGRTSGTGGKPPFVASLAWLIKAENFAKVIEGQYHRDGNA